MPLLIIYQHNFSTNDTFQYLSLARKYDEGNFSDAINGFISPMMIWLLVPIIKLNIDPILSCKIVELIIGGLVLIYLNRITFKIIENYIVRICLMFAFIPVVLSFALLYISSDLLFLAVLLIYLDLLLNSNYSDDKMSIKLGILGGLLYLAKSFGLYFFLVHLVIIYLLKYFKERKTEVYFSWKPLFKSLLIFFLICSAWIIPLSIKYHAFTISTGGSNLFKSIGPDYFPDKDMVFHHPELNNGLYPPTNSTAVSVWEEPNSIAMNSWSPFSSGDNFRHYLKVIGRNISSIYYHDFQKQAGVLFIVLFLLFIFFTENPLKKLPFVFYLLLFTYLLVSLAMSLIYYLPRYTMISQFLIIFMIAVLSETIITQKLVLNKTGFIFLGIALILMIKRPVKEILLLEDTELKSGQIMEIIKHPRATLKASLKRYDDHYEVMEKLRQIPDFKGRIASHGGDDVYKYVSMICYYLRLPYYGELPDKVIAETADKQLKQYDIDYYLDENPSAEDESYLLHNSKRIFTDMKTGLVVYKLK